MESSVAGLIGRRWGMLIVQQLASGPQRFNSLKAAMSGISSKTLSLNLKELERESIVVRRVLGSKPLRVEYSLTAKGESLTEVLEAIIAWGDRWIGRRE
jgi:DNA-binding HxlR family transcriptional regulator